MTKLDAILTNIHSLHLAALRTENLHEDNVEVSVKLAANMTVASPIFSALFVIIATVTPYVSTDELTVFAVIVSGIAIFGTSVLTDKVYESDINRIEQNATDILRNPEKGQAWARRQLLKIYLSQVFVVIILVVILRLIF